MPLSPETSSSIRVAERIADELSSEHYARNHEWGMTDEVMGLRAFSEDKFYKELAAYIRREYVLKPYLSAKSPDAQPPETKGDG